MNPSPLAWYEQRLSTLSTQLKALQKKDSWLGWLRFFALAIGITLAWLLFSKTALLAAAVVLLFLVVFVRLVYIDADNAAAIRNLQHLISITEQEIRQFSHEKSSFNLDYDPLQADPDYLVTGTMSDWTGIYPPEILERDFTLVVAFGNYRLYRRQAT